VEDIMTIARDAKTLAAKLSRQEKNKEVKALKAEQRKRVLANQGQMCRAIEEMAEKAGVKPDYDLVFNPEPRQMAPTVFPLAWLGGKMSANSYGGRSGRSGHLLEHTESIGENGSRTFAKQVDLALNPPAPEAPAASE
jgi:hypothetical protein